MNVIIKQHQLLILTSNTICRFVNRSIESAKEACGTVARCLVESILCTVFSWFATLALRLRAKLFSRSICSLFTWDSHVRASWTVITVGGKRNHYSINTSTQFTRKATFLFIKVPTNVCRRNYMFPLTL